MQYFVRYNKIIANSPFSTLESIYLFNSLVEKKILVRNKRIFTQQNNVTYFYYLDSQHFVWVHDARHTIFE